MILSRAEDYFATARERFIIKTRRESGHPWPWTTDPIFQQWRFCHVHREDDRTTVWFRENIREPLRDAGLHLIQATMIFRWFNRIETGEIIKDLILNPKWDGAAAEERLRDVKPVVTGAYMLRSPEGFTKLDGILYCIDRAVKSLPAIYKKMDFNYLESPWRELVNLYGLGPFMAYEIVSDLRWSPLLEKANDINTWANPGPGCRRGLGRVLNNDRRYFSHKLDANGEMAIVMEDLLARSRQERYWPFPERPWEMREVEHWACEFEKYCSAQGGRKLKRRYRESSTS